MMSHPEVELCDIPMSAWSIPKAVEAELKRDFVYFNTKIIQSNVSIRGDTTKILIELQDGHRVETVVMQHQKHATICVSSQIGCHPINTYLIG